jgi:hypothetical protein
VPPPPETADSHPKLPSMSRFGGPCDRSYCKRLTWWLQMLRQEPPSQEVPAGVTAAQHAQERQVQRVEDPQAVTEVAVGDRHGVRVLSCRKTLSAAIS